MSRSAGDGLHKEREAGRRPCSTAPWRRTGPRVPLDGLGRAGGCGALGLRPGGGRVEVLVLWVEGELLRVHVDVRHHALPLGGLGERGGGMFVVLDRFGVWGL